MVLTPYERGRSREYRAIRMLREDGWLCLRSAVSHGPVDIVAAKGGRVVLIQVKSGKGRVRRREVDDLRSWARAFRAQAEVWLFKKGGGVIKRRVYPPTRSARAR